MGAMGAVSSIDAVSQAIVFPWLPSSGIKFAKIASWLQVHYSGIILG